MGLRGNKRTRIQVEDQRKFTAQWYIQGVPQAEIGRRLAVTQQQVSYDLKVIQRRWNMDTAINLDAAKMRELAKLDELERVYWEGYHASQEPKKTTVTEREEVPIGQTGATVPRIRARVVTEEREGNPVFLGGVERCIEARRKLLGLDAPEKKELGGPGGGPIPILPVVVTARVLAEAAQILVELEEGSYRGGNGQKALSDGQP